MSFNNDIGLFQYMNQISIVDSRVFNKKGQCVAIWDEKVNVCDLFTSQGWKIVQVSEVVMGYNQIFLEKGTII